MQKIIVVFFMFFSTLTFADVRHVGKWVLSTEQNRVNAMTSSSTGGIINIACLPNNDLLLELYSFYDPNNDADKATVAVDNHFSIWNYQGNGVVSTPNGATIISTIREKKEIDVSLYYNQTPIVKYHFDIDGIDEVATTLKLICNESLEN